MNTKEIVSQLTLEEKAGLCSGADFWTLRGIERFDLSSIMVTDGPHGLRKQAGSSDHLGINQSVPATCFPTASATACSFDRDLMQKIGVALGEECLQEQVSVVLGPGANIKRSPLCGRNFEYISEDPYLTGQIASALIHGIQSNNVGVSLKHFAANNQEKSRMSSDSIIDERALREIYLAGFEAAVKTQQPWTLMCSYNKVNSVYACENKRILTDILRDEWGFEGLVMTDWGAMSDRVPAIIAGLDLEMPGPATGNTKAIIAAVNDGSLPVEVLDICVTRVLELLIKSKDAREQNYHYDEKAHHELARRAAAESSVLLKNDGNILPVKKENRIAVIGDFAKTPRYQGSGSSKINPLQLENAFDELSKKGANVSYAQGYLQGKMDSQNEDTLIKEACILAAQNEIAFVFAGMPDEYESEGFDRTTLDMPQSHNKLIAAVAAANPNTVVILQCGSPVLMPWKDSVKAILISYLGGQAGGGACADLLLGDTVPCGKLAETFPLSVEDTSCHLHFAKEERTAEYRESIFVGYRWYDTAQRDVLFPFGFGLSYTEFEYSDFALSGEKFAENDRLMAELVVTNKGKYDSSEIVQLYVEKVGSAVYRAKKELKGFEKVFLKAGESKKVRFELDKRSFAYYNTVVGDWSVEGGEYQIMVGENSRSIKFIACVMADGDAHEKLLNMQRAEASIYFNLPTNGILDVNDAAFTAIYGTPLPPKVRNEDEPFTRNSTIREIAHTEVGQQVLGMLQAGVAQIGGGDIQIMFEAMVMDLPLRSLSMLSGGKADDEQVAGIIAALNA